VGETEGGGGGGVPSQGGQSVRCLAGKKVVERKRGRQGKKITKQQTTKIREEKNIPKNVAYPALQTQRKLIPPQSAPKGNKRKGGLVREKRPYDNQFKGKTCGA